MTTTNITKARSNLFDLAERVVKFNDTINVTTKDGSFVMLSEEDYNNIMETLYLTSIPGVHESIVDGLNTPIEDCVELDWENELKWVIKSFLQNKRKRITKKSRQAR